HAAAMAGNKDQALLVGGPNWLAAVSEAGHGGGARAVEVAYHDVGCVALAADPGELAPRSRSGVKDIALSGGDDAPRAAEWYRRLVAVAAVHSPGHQDHRGAVGEIGG